MASDSQVREVRRIAEEHLDYDVMQCKHIDSMSGADIILNVDRPETRVERNNIYSGGNLRPFIEAGYLPLSVGCTRAWFKAIDVGLDFK